MIGARRTVVLAAMGLLAAGSAMASGWLDHGTTHAASEQPMVALTFDDGLNERYTLEVAAILERYGARGTFFVVGQTLTDQAPVARRLLDRGHLLADHSYDHRRLSIFDVQYSELARAQGAFEQVTGMCPRFFRPPFGSETVFTKAAVRRAGMQTVLWDVEVGDWSEADSARLAARVLHGARPGSIVLLHDGSEGRPGADRSVLVAALPAILEGLHERGLSAVTLDRLVGTSGYLERCG